MRFLSSSLLSLSLLFISNGSTASALVFPHQVDDSNPQNVNGSTLKIPGVSGDNVDPISDRNASRISSGTPTPISDDLRARIREFLPYAGASYCTSFQAGSVSGCGPPCDNLEKDNIFLYHAGNGDTIPHAQVLYSPTTKTLYIAHEGSNFSKLGSLLNDFVFVPVPIANSLRDGFKSSGQVNILDLALSFIHVGFQTAWSYTYNDIEQVVGKAIQDYDVQKIRVTGHSLGASIATLDTIALKGKFPDQTFENIVFASPRIFNPAGSQLYTELFEDPSSNVTHSNVVNSNDLVPHLGPLILGFEHSSGEVFLPVNGSQEAVNCPGTENKNCLLGRGLQSSLDFHDGPFLGTYLGRGIPNGCNAD